MGGGAKSSYVEKYLDYRNNVCQNAFDSSWVVQNLIGGGGLLWSTLIKLWWIIRPLVCSQICASWTPSTGTWSPSGTPWRTTWGTTRTPTTALVNPRVKRLAVPWDCAGQTPTARLFLGYIWSTVYAQTIDWLADRSQNLTETPLYAVWSKCIILMGMSDGDERGGMVRP